MPTWAISAASRSASPGCVFVMPALMLNYMGQGAMILSLDPAAPPRRVAQSLLLARAGDAAAAARHPRHLRDDHRQPGGDLRRLLGDPAGDPARLHPAPVASATPARRRSARSTSRSINWALMVMVILLVLFFRTSSNLAAAYGIAVTGAMFIDTCLLTVVLFSLWKWKPWLAIPLLAHLLPRRHRLFRRQPDQGAGRRLVPAAGRLHRLHLAHHLGARAAS